MTANILTIHHRLRTSRRRRILQFRLQAVKRHLLGKPFHINRSDVTVDRRDEKADWNYDHIEDDYYYGYNCCAIIEAHSISVAAALTPAKKVDEESPMRVTRDSLAVGTSRWLLGDSEFNMPGVVRMDTGPVRRADIAVQSTEYRGTSRNKILCPLFGNVVEANQER